MFLSKNFRLGGPGGCSRDVPVMAPPVHTQHYMFFQTEQLAKGYQFPACYKLEPGVEVDFDAARLFGEQKEYECSAICGNLGYGYALMYGEKCFCDDTVMYSAIRFGRMAILTNNEKPVSWSDCDLDSFWVDEL